MVKNRVKITESTLNRIIKKTVKESIKRVLNEGHWDSRVFDELSSIREQLGDDTVIREMYNWMDSTEIEGFIDNIKRMYELDGYDDEDEED